ncbi:type II toxin-antitoxin system death-on-curing family toxin [Stomatobaculum longum]|uniref:type II toxin-antitoxin system death-on-curing family toxin n=1 Tax=Stomatobaculum longum TaxID=796942 RepID=UPI002806406A|nr:type II toxin-antitoxin system death-on-curing family toxin [Stomatobaculum longum]
MRFRVFSSHETALPTKSWQNDLFNQKAAYLTSRTTACGNRGRSGIRDESLLESALYAPFQTFNQQDVYHSVQQKAARLGIGLTQNHAFIDGNKRIGAHAMLVFLALNQITITYTQKELSDTFLFVAAGQLSFEDLLEWILAHQT